MRFAKVGLDLWYSVVGSVSSALLPTRIQSQLICIKALPLIHEADRLLGTMSRRIDNKSKT